MGSSVLLGGELMFPSEYIKAIEFKGRDVTLTIATIVREKVPRQSGSKDECIVVRFKETPKKIILNKTNAASIAALYGPEAEKWAGQRVTFYPTKTLCGREMMDCIRVRDKVAQKPGPKPKVPDSTPAEADIEPVPFPEAEEVASAVV